MIVIELKTNCAVLPKNKREFRVQLVKSTFLLHRLLSSTNLKLLMTYLGNANL